MSFKFTENEKFSVLAVNSAFNYVKSEAELSDGTWVLPNLPADISELWTSWIGTLRLEKLKRANLILVRRVPSASPQNLDEEHQELFRHTMTIFWLVQLSGVVQYGGATALQGSFERGEANIRQMAHVSDYYPTEGAPKLPVTVDRLEAAVRMSEIWRGLKARGTHDRFRRGAVILRSGLEEQVGQDRIREFTRAIEALIRPDIGSTAKQFKQRGQTLGLKSKAAEEILFDAYQMRCDVEHIHPWDRHLQKYPEDGRLNIANMRVRQMEALARESYRRILSNGEIRAHFESDATLENFWSLPGEERQRIWGDGIDVTNFTVDDEHNEKLRQLTERHAM
jgi:hypothetical protein